MQCLDFELSGDPTQAPQMAKYMKHQFPFLGLKTPERKAQTKPLLKASRGEDLPTIRVWIDALYQRDAREYQYVAIDLALDHIKRWQFSDMQVFRQLVVQKSWWDTVDAWRKVFADYVRLHPDQKLAVFNLFFNQPSFWLRRIGINLQLLEKWPPDRTCQKAILIN